MTDDSLALLTEEEKGWSPCGYPTDELLRRLAEAREKLAAAKRLRDYASHHFNCMVIQVNPPH